jgi:hypothetical protein
MIITINTHFISINANKECKKKKANLAITRAALLLTQMFALSSKPVLNSIISFKSDWARSHVRPVLLSDLKNIKFINFLTSFIILQKIIYNRPNCSCGIH